MKVADLREQLRANNLKISGVKHELVDRLAKHLKSSKAKKVAPDEVDTSGVAPPPAPEREAAHPHKHLPEKLNELSPPKAPNHQTEEDASLARLVSSIEERAQVERDPSNTALPLTTVVEELNLPIEMPLSKPEGLLLENPSGLQSAEICINQTESAPAELDAQALRCEEELPSVPPPEKSTELLPSTTAAQPLEKSVSQFEEDTPAARTSEVCSAALQGSANIEQLSKVAPESTELRQKIEDGVPTATSDGHSSEECNLRGLNPACQNSQACSGEIAALDVPEKAPSSQQGERASRPRRRRVEQPTPVSPTAVLAPEVTPHEGTPLKSDDTPRQTWRQLCAREAARLRMDEEESASMDTSNIGRRSPSVPRSAKLIQNTRSPSRSPVHRSSKRAKVVLRRRTSLQGRGTRTLDSEAMAHRSASRSRSPISRRAPLQSPMPRNCLFPCTPRQDTHRNSKRTPTSRRLDLDTTASLTPRELQARMRADELRKELLEKSAMMKSAGRSAKTGLDLCPPPGNWQSPPSSTAQIHDHSVVAAPRNLESALQEAAAPRNLESMLHKVAGSEQHVMDSAEKETSQGDQKMRILAKLTQQMQVCLVRVQDQRLDDNSREKYQALASSIKVQLENISSIRCPAGSPMAKGGC